MARSPRNRRPSGPEQEARSTTAVDRSAPADTAGTGPVGRLTGHRRATLGVGESRDLLQTSAPRPRKPTAARSTDRAPTRRPATADQSTTAQAEHPWFVWWPQKPTAARSADRAPTRRPRPAVPQSGRRDQEYSAPYPHPRPRSRRRPDRPNRGRRRVGRRSDQRVGPTSEA